MNRDIEHYLNLPYPYKITPDPKLGFFIEIPDLPGCWADGKTIEEAIEDVEDSKELWLEEAIEKGIEVPLPSEEREYSGQYLLRMPKSLHRAIHEEAAWEDVSMNQYLVTLITENRHIRAITPWRELGFRVLEVFEEPFEIEPPMELSSDRALSEEIQPTHYESWAA